MLVKFLSYVASIIGARRYKPILFSFAILTLVVTGVTMVATALTGSSHDSASIVQEKYESSKQNQSSSDLRGLSRQEEKSQDQGVSPPPIAQTIEPSKPVEPPAKTKQNTIPDFTLSSSSIVLGSSATTLINASLNSTAGGGETFSWTTTTPGNINGLSAGIETAKDTNHVAVRITTNDLPAGNYQVSVTAKDQANGLSTTKTISITINL